MQHIFEYSTTPLARVSRYRGPHGILVELLPRFGDKSLISKNTKHKNKNGYEKNKNGKKPSSCEIARAFFLSKIVYAGCV